MAQTINVTIEGGFTSGQGTIDSGSLGTMDGGTASKDFTIDGVSDDENVRIEIFALEVDGAPSFDADYAFNYDWSQKWDDSASEVDIDVTVNWDTDPGTGNDVDLKYLIR